MTEHKQTALRNVAIAGGTGGIGAYISRSFASRKEFSTRVLVQKGDGKEAPKDKDKAALLAQLKSLGVALVEVDYASEASLAAALTGVDAVVSAVGGPLLLDGQLALVKAAKAAGVKRFVPSEFGSDNAKVAPYHIAFAGKEKVKAAVLAAGLEYTGIKNELFNDFIFSELMGVDWKNSRVAIFGAPDVRVTTTHKSDVGRLLPEVLLRPEATRNRSLFFAGETITWATRADLLEQATGRKWERYTVTAEEIKKRIAEKEAAEPKNPFVAIYDWLQWFSSQGWTAVPIGTKPFNEAISARVASALESLLDRVHPLKTVAVYGATGQIGQHLARGLLARPGEFAVRLLLRPETAALADAKAAVKDEHKDKAALVRELAAAGAALVAVTDFKSVDEQARALAGADAVVSAVGGPALGEQAVQIAAAKKAGVRRFVPSEYGIDLDIAGEGDFFLFAAKRGVSEALEKSGLEWTSIISGLFYSFAFGPLVGVNKATRTVTAYGSWDARVQATAEADIGRLVAEALRDPSTRNSHVTFYGADLSFAELADLVDGAAVAAGGAKFKRELVTREAIDAGIAAAKSPFELPAIIGRLHRGILASSDFYALRGRGAPENWAVQHAAGAAPLQTAASYLAAALKQ